MISDKPLSGKTSMVTGANSGIGEEVALALATMGATVVMVCRDATKGEAARNEIITRSRNKMVELMVADLSSLASVRVLAQKFLEVHDKLHILVNNAGVIMGGRVVTPDHLETTFEVNYLSHYLLTMVLLDVLKGSAPSRIVNVTSGAHYNGKMDFDDLQEEKAYGAMKSYCQSKLAQVLFTHELAKKLEGTGVTVNAVHPGAVRTRWGDEAGALGIGIRIARPFMLSPEKGAQTPIYVATSPEVEGITGKYWEKKKEKEPSKESNDENEARLLWAVSAKLAGV
ncbi:MAG TPA: SDR family oxidoreductase [Nitrososphaerales archaeon]|nr:SDR family oxidoreductase [Nitrososphaerales archaeon]